MNKCKDSKTRHITYSDFTCPKSDIATEIEAPRSLEALSAERKSAAQAQEQTALRFQREAQATRPQVETINAGMTKPATSGSDLSKSYECSTAKYALDVAKNRITPIKGGTDSYQDQVDIEDTVEPLQTVFLLIAIKP